LNEFAERLLTWFEVHQRDLPWRRTRDPYAIWISETMLQQTQVATAIGFYERWLERFPTVAALAEAPIDDVLKQWQGLGYYARARNLHKAARQIVEQHEACFPTTYEEVLALPGVGRYTAGAVCSIALGLDTPIVDANVIRVLGRAFAISGDPKSGPTQKVLWQLAEQLIPPGQAAAFNQAMMELGALVCDAAPKCDRCPVHQLCEAKKQGNPTAFPELAPKAEFTKQIDVCVAIFDGERLLLTKRPDSGLWAGLYEMPRVTATASESVEAAAIRAAFEICGLQIAVGPSLAIIKHGVTTKKITLHAISGEILSGTIAKNTVWATFEDCESLYPLSSPQAKLIQKIQRPEPQLALF
jgi:A/G-specific adenine glycosylase